MDEIISRCVDAMEAAKQKYDHVSAEVQRDIDELVAIIDELRLSRKRVDWPKKLKKQLYEQQNGLCGSGCGRRLPQPNTQSPARKRGQSHEPRYHVDHVIPWAKGGQNDLDNLQLLLAECNLAKGTRCDPDDVIRVVENILLNLPRDAAIAGAKSWGIIDGKRSEVLKIGDSN
jgi:hypothetical protein